MLASGRVIVMQCACMHLPQHEKRVVARLPRHGRAWQHLEQWWHTPRFGDAEAGLWLHGEVAQRGAQGWHALRLGACRAHRDYQLAGELRQPPSLDDGARSRLVGGEVHQREQHLETHAQVIRRR